MKKTICTLLVAAMLLSGCSKKENTASNTTGERVENTSITTSIENTSDAPETSATTEPDGTVTETTTETTTESTTAATSDKAKTSAPFTFNPHVHTTLLSELVTEDMWASLYNLIDAVRAGEDTFECTDRSTYDWCTDVSVFGTFYPPVSAKIEGAGFENGVGKIKYLMDKPKLKEREEAYEKEVTRMLNEATCSDYSDFEKLVGIYGYLCKNFTYDYSSIDGADENEFGDYACLTTKKGICCEIASVFSYLLLQVGVEATTFGGDGSAGNHDWTYVLIDGKGYHCDVTWALYGNYVNGFLELSYFMQTEEERLANGFDKESLEVDQIWPHLRDYDISRFSATDNTFAPIHQEIGMTFDSIDTEKNILRYSYGDQKYELNYGDM